VLMYRKLSINSPFLGYRIIGFCCENYRKLSKNYRKLSLSIKKSVI
jgi:hypothetical protein